VSLSAHALPCVWRAHELARSSEAGLDTGHAPLNAVLPGGGWPRAALTELLQRRPGWGEWGLLLPALAQVCGPGRVAVLVGAPHLPLGPALAARGLPPSRLLQVRAVSTAERLWAAEQALRCADVASVLVWLDQVQPAQLRRLHLAAQDHAKLLFVCRPERAQHESSPAPLRLLLGWQVPAATVGPGPAAAVPLWVWVLKRRGPPLEVSLPLLTAAPRVQALLAASRAQARLRRAAAWPLAVERAHALDRAASLV